MSSEVTVRPFTVDLAEENLVDLRRLADTRWPDRETVTDHSEGVPLARLHELVHYWGTNYDRRAVEARLNALSQFMTETDGLDVFPGGIYRMPRNGAERCYCNLIYRNEVDRGGHFAAREQPSLFTSEIWAAFRPVR